MSRGIYFVQRRLLFWFFEKKFRPSISAGGLLIGRTIAVLITMTLSTSMAAQGGTLTMAGHEICLQVWLAVSLLNDALALAGQVKNFQVLWWKFFL